MGGTADAPPPPPPSGHSCSWRELSQRFSWFCLKPLSPPGKRDQADILVRHPEVGNALDPPFFRARAGATRTGAGSIVPTAAVTVTKAGHDRQRQGWHESAAHTVLSTRLTVPRNRLTDKHASVQHQCAAAASPTSPWEAAKAGGWERGRQKAFFQDGKHHQNYLLAAHQSRAVRQLGQSFGFTCPQAGAALQCIPPSNTPEEGWVQLMPASLRGALRMRLYG